MIIYIIYIYNIYIYIYTYYICYILYIIYILYIYYIILYIIYIIYICYIIYYIIYIYYIILYTMYTYLRGIQRWLGGKSSIEDLELYVFPTINLYLDVSENSVPLNPMVLLIMIPMKNGYFIGNIPNIFRQTHIYIYIFPYIPIRFP